ncbi:type I-B CRISPR-associated protein Cas8b1/Cst1 [Enterococcus sp. BWT-B8]|uniref:type I-B CRISPR-associated protein Cas8b1/Cst1 n=1 Tax=Enterococcus sp. BWT-B8 TaxID=2885157 RepID=UPI001E529F83|nr:type I-B CRISPR-associated protein Cas8b1/Cst1 [Enterococcus sp. BWT-B8]MCB5951162.1 type I-B CRISPR-associated protein Cas8b1/Cst1 [Enterococcus sp. BWT-B8]
MTQETIQKIRVPLNDWQINSGIVGFLNILGNAEKLDKVDFSAQEIRFDPAILEGFENDYFNYFIRLYEKTTSWYKITSFKEKIEKYEAEDFQSFDEKALEDLNEYITKIAKYYIKANSYKSVYPLVANETDIETIGKELKTISKLKAKETFEARRGELIAEVKERFQVIKAIIAYFEDEEVKRHICAKNVLYTVIRNGWDGVSALNPQTKEKDVYKDFYAYYVAPCIEYLEAEKGKYKFSCSTCNEPIKNMDNTFSFLVATGFDTKRKNSHAWNHLNDLALCPICKLIYACVPAGFLYVYSQGIFVNANASVDELQRIREQLEIEMFQLNEIGQREVNVYVALIRTLNEEKNRLVNHELADIQVVRFENESYRFTLLPKRILQVLAVSRNHLNALIKTGFKEGNVQVNLYQTVLQKLFNSENLFTFIHKLLLYKATHVLTLYYGVVHVEKIIQINQEFLGGVKPMEKLSQDELGKIRGAGWHFKQAYKNSRKVDGIVYKLLNALKINNRDGFMDILLNCYSYQGRQVPKWFIQIFEDEETFKTIGYSFVAGIIGEEYKGENE